MRLKLYRAEIAYEDEEATKGVTWIVAKDIETALATARIGTVGQLDVVSVELISEWLTIVAEPKEANP